VIPLATAAGDVIVDAGKAIEVGRAASGWFRGDPLGVVSVVFAVLFVATLAYLIWRTRRFDAREDAHAKQLDEMRGTIERAQERTIGALTELIKHESDDTPVPKP
jgi:hypothetical protein